MKRRDPHQWTKERHRDKFFQQAKQDGYRARSCYKLIELQEKLKLIHPKSNVLDLGAAPGAWLQVIKKLTKGVIKGIDLLPIEPMDNVQTLQADIFSQEASQFLSEDVYDVILSDMAPNCSGQQKHNHLVIMNLVYKVLELSCKHLKEGGSMCVKIFDGSQLPEFVKEWRKVFKVTKRIKPKASANDSNEFYLIGIGHIKSKIDESASENDVDCIEIES